MNIGSFAFLALYQPSLLQLAIPYWGSKSLLLGQVQGYSRQYQFGVFLREALEVDLL
jgi:hypothetical protein